MQTVKYWIGRAWLEVRFKVGMYLSTKGEHILSSYVVAARALEQKHGR